MPFRFLGGIYAEHDKWVELCALCHNGCYYLNKQLSGYRVHGENTVGSAVYKNGMIDRIRRIYNRRVKNSHRLTCRYTLYTAIARYLEYYHLDTGEAYETAKKLVYIGERQIDAGTSGRLNGAYKIIKLYRDNLRYRLSGRNDFLYQLAEILLVKPVERRKYVEEIVEYTRRPLLCLNQQQVESYWGKQ